MCSYLFDAHFEVPGPLQLRDLVAHFAPGPAEENRGFIHRVMQPDALGLNRSIADLSELPSTYPRFVRGKESEG